MSLSMTYLDLKKSIVAFVAKHSLNPEYAKSNKFPNIIGTGFIFDSNGLILTNDHVIKAFSRLPKPQGTDPLSAVAVLMLYHRGDTIYCVSMEIKAVTMIEKFNPPDKFFQRTPPDIAIVGVSLSNLPECKIRLEPGGIEEGMPIATAGFPMGQQLLNSPDGQIAQLSPMLQTGIVGAMQPFATLHPTSFTINVLLQNGASGSPVFNPQNGEVIGIAYRREFEPSVGTVVNQDNHPIIDDTGRHLKILINLPTNYSYAVPTYFLGKSINDIKANMNRELSSKQKTLEQYFSECKLQDGKTGEIIDNTGKTQSNTTIIKLGDSN